MPEKPPSRADVTWQLSNAEAVGQVVKIACVHCSTKRYYFPADLISLLGNTTVGGLTRRMCCEKCKHKDYLNFDLFVPSAAERQRIKMRRLAGIKTRRIPVWRDE